MSSSTGYVTEGFTNPPNYSFPHHRLQSVLRDDSKTPVVLVACGSFSPVTFLHLRMFEMARDYIRHNTEFEVVGTYLSPVSDMYKKPGLLNARHRIVLEFPGQLAQRKAVFRRSFGLLRAFLWLFLFGNLDRMTCSYVSTTARVNMCNLASEDSGGTLMVDPWEAFQSYQRTAIVLDHFDYEVNTVLGGITTESGERRNVHVMLLAGSDLISTMSEPGVWSYSDLEHILGRYGVFIVERAGSGMDQATDSLAKWRHNIYLISQLIQNDVSSTKVRLFLRRGLSVRYLLPNSVVDYIEANGLYLDETNVNNNTPEKGKDRETSGPSTSKRDSASLQIPSTTDKTT